MVILTSLGSGCFQPPEPASNSYLYSINIEANRSFNFTVYAPFVNEYGSNQSIEAIFSNIMAVEGSVCYNIIETEYGLALKIESKDTLQLRSNYRDPGEYQPLSLSMQSGNTGNEIKEHWIFCDGNEQGELRVSIVLEARAGECCSEFRTEVTEPQFQTISTDGWQKITTLFTILE